MSEQNVSQQTILVRLEEDAEPEVAVVKTLLQAAKEGEPDQRGLYLLSVVVKI